MGKTAPYIPQWLKLAAGFWAVWLCTALPVRAAEATAQLLRQTYFSSNHSEPQADIGTTFCNREAVVLSSLRSGFSFAPTLLFVPSLLSATFKTSYLPLPTRLRSSVFPFFFLRLVFEHQIAINAP